MFDMIKSSPLLWLIIFLAVVAPSFLVGAMQVVLFIILGIFLFFIIMGFVFRAKIKNMQKKMEEQMRGAAGQQYRANKTPEEGDVNIFTTSKTRAKRVRDDVGEYVDFEEIKK